MNSLIYMSCEKIRENWKMLRIDKNNPYYEMVWRTLVEKFNLNEKEEVFEKLKNFVLSDKKTLSIFNLGKSSEKMQKYADLCLIFGIEYRITYKNGTLILTKPKTWLWEFTEPMFTQRKNIEKRKRAEKALKKFKFTRII